MIWLFANGKITNALTCFLLAEHLRPFCTSPSKTLQFDGVCNIRRIQGQTDHDHHDVGDEDQWPGEQEEGSNRQQANNDRIPSEALCDAAADPGPDTVMA